MITSDHVFLGGAREGQALGTTDPGSWRRPGAWSWIVLTEPDGEELERVRHATGLDVDVLEQVRQDAIRPTATSGGQSGIVGYRVARYRLDPSRIEMTDIVLAFGPDYVVVVSDDREAVRELEANLAKRDGKVRGPVAVFELSADLVIDSYLDVIEGLDVDIKRVERQVFSDDDTTSPVEQIYRLRRIVADLEEDITRLTEESTARLIRRRLPSWMAEVPEWFAEGTTSLMEHDEQFERMVTRVQGLRGLLDSILNANLVQVGIQQNVDMRKISAWVAIAAIPTLVAGIYGMNFEHMPELSWRFGYPVTLVLMAATCGLLYWRFRRNDWL